MSSSILILGAGSAIARACAQELATQGKAVLLAGRDVPELEHTASDLRIRHGATVSVLSFEATDFASHGAFFQRCLDAAGGDVEGVILCHGNMFDQKSAQSDPGLVCKMVDVNLTSAMVVLEAAARHLEEKKRGWICAITSVAGDRGRQSNYLYGATKAGLNTYLDGLRHRLYRSGVAVVTVKPGFVDTRMTWGLPGLFLVAQPSRVARDILTAVRKRRSVVYTPWFWRYIMTIIRCVPGFVFHRTKM